MQTDVGAGEGGGGGGRVGDVGTHWKPVNTLYTPRKCSQVGWVRVLVTMRGRALEA